MKRGNHRGILVGLGLGLSVLFPAPCRSQDADVFFKLYADWRVQQQADYNLDGLVNYWDALCLSYLWSGESCHRFYMAGGGTGGAFDVVRLSSTELNLPVSTVMAYPPTTLLRPGLGEFGGLPINIFLAAPPMEIVRTAAGESGGLSPNTNLAAPPVDIVRAAVGEPGGLDLNTRVAAPPVEVVRPAMGELGGNPANTTLAMPPVTIRWATAGKSLFGWPYYLQTQTLGLVPR